MNQNANTIHNVASPNVPGLSDSEVVDIELAKGRLHGVIDQLHSHPQFKTDAVIAKALTNTVRTILVEAGVTSEVGFHNLFTEMLNAKLDEILDLLDLEPDDAIETEETVG